MDAVVTLLILLFFLLVPVLPAIVTLLMRKVAGHNEQAPPVPSMPERPLWPPPRRTITVFPEHPREELPEAPNSLEIIPRRPASLEEISPEERPSPLRPHAETGRRLKSALVRRPIDVRRAIVLGILLGAPRAENPD
jgi:hypothetical protein